MVKTVEIVSLLMTAMAVFLTTRGISLPRDNHPMERFVLFVMSLGWAVTAGFALEQTEVTSKAGRQS